MQSFLTQHTNNLALEIEKFASQKDKIYFTDKISKYSNTSLIRQLVNYALLTFSADPIIIPNNKTSHKCPNLLTILTRLHNDNIKNMTFVTTIY